MSVKVKTYYVVTCRYSYYGGFIVAIIMVFVWLCMMAVGIVNLVADKENGIGMVGFRPFL